MKRVEGRPRGIDLPLGAWETAGQIRMSWISDPTFAAITVATKEAKHPAVAVSPRGTILVSWLQGSGWNRGGAAMWQEFDAELHQAGKPGNAGAVPAWGRATAYAEPNGDFVILR